MATALGIAHVALDDDFLALGGDSIVSIQAAAAARRTGFTLDPKMILMHRTPRAIAVCQAAEPKDDRLPSSRHASPAAAVHTLEQSDQAALIALFETEDANQ